MRKSEQYFIFMGILVGLFVLSFLDAHWRGGAYSSRLAVMSGQVSSLDLTDLSLFTEARYTRHPSQADRHSAFQDHPLALEHFPSGSLVLPPEALR